MQLALIVFGAVAVLGMYAANRLLTTHPLAPATLSGCGMSVLVAAGVGAMARRVARRRAIRGWLARMPRWVPLGITLGLTGVTISTAAALALPLGHPDLHRLLVLLAVATFAGLATLLARRVDPRPLAALAVAAALALAAPALGAHRRATVLASQPPAALYYQTLRLVRSAFDADGDGYSDVLDGGDCDDGDRTAYPLSLVGRDCLGWVPAAATPAPAIVPPAIVPAADAPQILVLVTIDAFRCGFGVGDRPPLRDICPRLTALAAEGRARTDLHTVCPSTSCAVSALHLGEGDRGPALATLLGGAGYRTHAIATHGTLLADRRIRSSFAELDATLVPVAVGAATTTAAATTDRALAWLGQVAGAGAGAGRAFLWVHYYDPHAPYVKTPGSPVITDHLAAYATEVRRTDAEIARLIDGVRALPRSREALVAITADHGEAFGEHGAEYHVSSVHEGATRIPFLLWSPAGLARHAARPLPVSLADVRPFLLALVTGGPFAPSDESLIETTFADDPQVAVVRDGWKLIRHVRLGYDELYDLGVDPGEENDRAAAEPERVLALGRRIGAHLRRRR
jgi:hypothetical protein